MLEEIFAYLCAHAAYAGPALFGLLLLAGLNIPISEDVVLISGGVIVALCIPENYLSMFLWLYAGCIFSAYEAYWLGRKFGPKLYDMRLFRHVVTRPRIERLNIFIERYGIMTFIVGRFIPGGIRNGLFITSGLGGMPFPTFALRDGFAAMISTTTLFHLGYFFGDHYQTLFDYLKIYNHTVMVVIGIGAIALLLYFWRYYKKES